MRFAAIDYECNTVQIAILFHGNQQEAFELPSQLEYYIDGKEINDYAFITEQTWHGKYVFVLLKNINTDLRDISVTYNEKTATFS